MDASKEMRILVVDDHHSMRAIIRNSLFKLGYEHIVEAENGKVALAKLQTEKIDFVISDWSMPEMSGIDLLKTIRSNQKLQSLPVLLVTAEALTTNIVEAVKARVNGYIVKPFTEETLRLKIQDIFGKQSAPSKKSSPSRSPKK